MFFFSFELCSEINFHVNRVIPYLSCDVAQSLCSYSAVSPFANRGEKKNAQSDRVTFVQPCYPPPPLVKHVLLLESSAPYYRSTGTTGNDKAYRRPHISTNMY